MNIVMDEFEYNGKAMGTECSVAIVCDSKELANQAYKIAKDDIEAYEAKFSRFLPSSELSLLNEKKDMVVSEDFLNATLAAHRLFVETKGVFNPLVQIARLGYDKNFEDIHSGGNIEDEDSYDIDFSSVVIDSAESRVRLGEGQKLDYGGFLKGYLAEIIAKKIKQYSPRIVGVIVNLGGDIHTRGYDKDGNKFVFSIYNPILKNEDIKTTVHDQSLATSGAYKRSWSRFGKKIHHILDASGRFNPKSNIVSASVICEDGGRSEACAKVFLSLGHENALKLFAGEKIYFVVINEAGQVIRNMP